MALHSRIRDLSSASVIRIAPSHTIEAHCKMGGANAGAVVALGDGGVFGDAALRWTDSSLMPGIQQNARLADNLICYAVKIAGAGVTPAQHCKRAEKNLATFVLTALQLHCGVKWWHKGIPLNIRQECVQRKEEEPHREFPKDAYLNLIDLKKIMERNWPLFQSYFKKIGESQSKDKALSWMERFNEIRRLQAHP